MAGSRRDEFHHDGHRKMRHHSGPEIARQSAAHIQRNHRPNQGKDWMGGRIDPGGGAEVPAPGGSAPMPAAPSGLTDEMA